MKNDNHSCRVFTLLSVNTCEMHLAQQHANDVYQHHVNILLAFFPLLRKFITGEVVDSQCPMGEIQED